MIEKKHECFGVLDWYTKKLTGGDKCGKGFGDGSTAYPDCNKWGFSVWNTCDTDDDGRGPG